MINAQQARDIASAYEYENSTIKMLESVFEEIRAAASTGNRIVHIDFKFNSATTNVGCKFVRKELTDAGFKLRDVCRYIDNDTDVRLPDKKSVSVEVSW